MPALPKSYAYLGQVSKPVLFAWYSALVLVCSYPIGMSLRTSHAELPSSVGILGMAAAGSSTTSRAIWNYPRGDAGAWLSLIVMCPVPREQLCLRQIPMAWVGLNPSPPKGGGKGSHPRTEELSSGPALGDGTENGLLGAQQMSVGPAWSLVRKHVCYRHA